MEVGSEARSEKRSEIRSAEVAEYERIPVDQKARCRQQ
jgi:hypothetical protein